MKNNAAFDYAAFDYAQAACYGWWLSEAVPSRWLSEAETTVCFITHSKTMFQKLGI